MSEMLKSKTTDRICCAALAAMLLLTALVWAGKASEGRKSTIQVGYEGLFDQSAVHTIDIEIADWDSFLDSATQELYAECSVTIDGEKISNVGIRGKGNTSLSSVSTMGSEKYSFKIEFDQYVKGRSYHGLDKLSLNNLIYDATMMKDYLAYTLMNREGVPAPLCSFVQITVNGEPWGLYLAVEGVEDSFLERNNMTTGDLYKPDSLSFGGGRGNGRGFDFEQFRVKDGEDSDGTQSDSSSKAPSGDSFGDFGGFSFGGQTMPSGFSGQMPSGMTPPDGAPAPNGADFSGSFQMPGSAGTSDGSLGEGSSGGFSMPGGMDFPGGMGGFGGFSMPDGSGSAGGFQMPGGTGGEGFSRPGGSGEGDTGFPAGGMGYFSFGGGMFNFGTGSSDVRLQYTDDDPASYANIFDSAKTTVTKKDQKRLIEALKTLSSENARDAVFTYEVISYLAVHDFLQNDDSYTGMMVHNYYLYEENGRLAILPWDYNLAFGGMGGGGDAAATVNSPIDSPVSSGSLSDRPLVSWIFEDEEALKQYHEVYSQFIADTIENGWLEEEIQRVAALIRPYVEADKNSFFSMEEFDAAVEALQTYCAKRGESVRGQLDGTIPSTSEEQRKSSSVLVDAGDLDISAMGSMNTGGGGRQGGFSMPDTSSFSMPGAGGSDSFPGSSFGSPSGFSKPDSIPSGKQADKSGNPDGQAKEREQSGQDRQPGERAQIPSGFTPPDSGMQNGQGSGKWLTVGLYALILLAAVFAVSRIKGHNA